MAKKRQRPRIAEGSPEASAEPAPKPNTEESSQPATIVDDPDGTLNVARSGEIVKASAQKEQLDKLSKSQQKQFKTHLHGNQGDLAVQRREQLQQDDSNPNAVSTLTESQQRHLKHRSNKKTKVRLDRLETKRWKAAMSAVEAVDILQGGDTEAGILQAETDMERTTALTQTELKRRHLDRDAAKQIFDLSLPSPYRMHYDRSGRYSLLAGQAGHVAIMDALQQSLVTEFHLPNERVRDATFLHNFTLCAVAQRNHVYIYDHTGAEIHTLSQHSDPMKLQFLPYHWLLASIGRAGYLKYQDTSTGDLVSTHRTGLGCPTALRQNNANAVLHAGHANGVVTLWSPASSKYLAKLHCHKGAAVTALAVDLDGRTMVTGGMDRQIRVWDLRMYQERHAYFCAAGVPTSLDISQRGLLAVGHAGHVTVWGAEALTRKTKSPYMHHTLGPAGQNLARGAVESVRFRPFEDVCGVGHAKGVSSIVIPGSGEPALDTSEYHTNPLADAKQRQESEVRALLDKLSPDMISMDADAVGGMEASDPLTRLERLRDTQAAANGEKPAREKNKKRGRSKIQTKLKRKHKNIVDKNTVRLKEAREQELQALEHAEKGTKPESSVKDTAPTALKRFF